MNNNDLLEYINNLGSCNVNRIIYPLKAYRNDQNILKKLLTKLSCQFMIVEDYDPECFFIDNNKTSNLIADLVIIMKQHFRVGSYIDSIYEKEFNKFVCNIKVDIKY